VRVDPSVLHGAVRAVELGVLLGADLLDADRVYGPLPQEPTHPALLLPLYLVV
jgi:hypothetical protein